MDKVNTWCIPSPPRLTMAYPLHRWHFSPTKRKQGSS